MLLLEFAVACLIIEITPGPNMSYLAALALMRGVRAALQAIVGVACGLMIVGLLAAVGLSQLVVDHPVVMVVLRWGGVLFMLWLAVDSWRNAGKAIEQSGSREFGSFWRGLATNLLNPKLMIFYLVMLPEHVSPAATNLLFANLTLVMVYVAIATAVHVAIVLCAGHIRQFMDIDKNAKLVGRVMAILLLGVAAWIFASTR